MTTSRTLARPASKSPLTGSASSAKREKTVLRRARERLEEEPRVGETTARTSIAARRTRSA
jgi:hypothetical protein